MYVVGESVTLERVTEPAVEFAVAVFVMKHGSGVGAGRQPPELAHALAAFYRHRNSAKRRADGGKFRRIRARPERANHGALLIAHAVHDDADFVRLSRRLRASDTRRERKSDG